MLADEARERTNGGKPLVARGDGAVTGDLDVGEKESDAISGDVDHMETVDRFPGLLRNERNELAKCISIAVLGVAGEIAFGDDMLQQETPNPGAKGLIRHEKTPWRNVRNGGLPREAIRVSA
jgi:hypothetical protein